MRYSEITLVTVSVDYLGRTITTGPKYEVNKGTEGQNPSINRTTYLWLTHGIVMCILILPKNF